MSDETSGEAQLLDVEGLSQRLQMLTIGTESVSAKARKLGRVDQLNLGFGWNWAEVNDHLFLKCEVTCRLLDSEPGENGEIKDEQVLAEITGDLVATYKIAGPTGQPFIVSQPETVVVQFAEKYAMRDMFPYIREMITSLASRVGMGRVGLGNLPSAEGV